MTINKAEVAEALEEAVNFINRMITTSNDTLRGQTRHPKTEGFELDEVYRAMELSGGVSSHAKEAIEIMSDEGRASNVYGALYIGNGDPSRIRSVLSQMTKNEKVIDLIVSCFPASGGHAEVMGRLGFARDVRPIVAGVEVDDKFKVGFKDYLLRGNTASLNDFKSDYSSPGFVAKLSRVYDLLTVKGDVSDEDIHEVAELVRELSPHTVLKKEKRASLRLHADRISVCLWYHTGQVMDAARETIKRRVAIYAWSRACVSRYRIMLKSHLRVLQSIVDFFSEGGDIEDLAGLVPPRMHTHACLHNRIRDMYGSYDYIIPEIGYGASDLKNLREALLAALVDYRTEGFDGVRTPVAKGSCSTVSGSPELVVKEPLDPACELPEAGGAGYEPDHEDEAEVSSRGDNGPLF